MPNGMPFIVQAEIKQGMIDLDDVMVYPILEKNSQKGLAKALILEPLYWDNIGQKKQLAQRLVNYLNNYK